MMTFQLSTNNFILAGSEEEEEEEAWPKLLLSAWTWAKLARIAVDLSGQQAWPLLVIELLAFGSGTPCSCKIDKYCCRESCDS
eukprot:1537362-Amphidinium_carterae.1